jgi:hypothetical protein
MRYDCGPFSLELPGDWFDTTADEEPFTLTKKHGNGALQFSVAQYLEGAQPIADAAALDLLLREFAESHALGPLRDTFQENSAVSFAGGTFSARAPVQGRAWYASDGWSIAKITFVWESQVDEHELREAEQIVRSLFFSNSDA